MLPDKGERIQKLYDTLLREINARNVVDQAAALFSELNIVEKGVQAVTQMEWNGGKMNGNQIVVAADTLESDEEDDIDPLKIIAQSRNTVKLVKVAKPPQSLITETDLQEIKSIQSENKSKNDENSSANTSTHTASDETDTNKSNSSIELEPHALYMIQKDKAFDKDAQIKQKFLPYRTTKSDVHDIDKEKQRKHGKNWEITAATPPNLRNSAVQMIPLHESIQVEKQHKEKLREQMEKQAEERLATRKKIVADNISLLPPGSELLNANVFFQSYRQREDDFDENQHSEDEHFSDCSDDGEEPDTGGVSVFVPEC